MSTKGVFRLWISLILPAVMVLAIITSFNISQAQTQPLTLPNWQFIHVDTVNPQNSAWDENWAVGRMSIISDTLYLGTFNEAAGGEMWRTTNGVSWEQVHSNGFGSGNNRSIMVGDAFKGHLYMGTWNPVSGGEIWRCSVCDGTDLQQVAGGGFGDSNNVHIQRIITHTNGLIAVSDNSATGGEVWRSITGDSGSWQQCNSDGFGDSNNTELYAVTSFGGYLYAATAQWQANGNNTQTGTELWRTTDCSNWQQVNVDGFGNRNNVGGWIASFNSHLYVLTHNVLNGLEVWRCSSCDGSDWVRVITGGFGDTANTAGGMMLAYDNEFYLATANRITGSEIWRSADGLSWSQINIDSFNFPDNEDVWSGMVYKNHLYVGTVNQTSGGQVRRLLANPASLTLPAEGKVEVNFISVGGPSDLTGCTGDFGLDSPRLELIYSDYLYSNNLTFPVSGFFPQNSNLVFYLHPDPNALCTGDRYVSTEPDRAFVSQPEPDTWIISWEDWTDEDFNDLHVEITFHEQISPFLDLPFNSQTYRSFSHAVNALSLGGAVSSYFDHKYPTYSSAPNSTYAGVVTFHGYDSGNPQENPGFTLYYDGHDGIDFAVTGQSVEVLAAADGTVADKVPATPGTCNCDGTTIQEKCLGNHVIITHTNGLATTYGHLASFDAGLVKGEAVDRGAILGVMGSTGCSSGPHIHFSVDRSGQWPIVSPLKTDPFGWLAARFPDSTYGKSGNPDPWWAFHQSQPTPKNAQSDYLWREALGRPVLSQPSTATAVASADGAVLATFPVNALSSAFRAELWPTLSAPDIVNAKGSPTHGFALYAFVPGDIPVWNLQSPVAIEVSVEALGMNGVAGAYHAYRWDDVADQWIEQQVSYNAATGRIAFTSDRLGRFVVTNSVSRIYLPIAVSGGS